MSAAPNPKPSSHRRPPLLPSDVGADNGVGHRKPKAREVTSRYMASLSSPSSSSSSSSSANSPAPKRSASPLVPRTAPAAVPSSVKQAQSVERRRPPGTPWASTVDSRSGNGGQVSRVLFTATRSLSVSFQGESFSLQVSKSKPAPSQHIARKGTPEKRKPTPVRGGRSDGFGGGVDQIHQAQIENSKPVDQLRWPARSRQGMIRSVDLADEGKGLSGSRVPTSKSLQSTMHETPRAFLKQSVMNQTPKPSVLGILESSLGNGELVKAAPPAVGTNSVIGRLHSNMGNEELEKVAQPAVGMHPAIGSSIISHPVVSDTESVSSGCSSGAQECSGRLARGQGGTRGMMVPARFSEETNNRFLRLPEPGSSESKGNGLKIPVSAKLIVPKKLPFDSSTSSPRTTPASRGMLSPLRGPVRSASPNKLTTSSTSSPLKRMASPSRARTPTVSTLSNNPGATPSPSILNFSADVRRGKLGENRIVDAHSLRLLYNQQMQWRFVNARADAAMLARRLMAEKCLYNVWIITLKLRDSVKGKRKELQFSRQILKITSVLKGQMLYLQEWDFLKRDHANSLSGAIEALEASTRRLPLVGGTRADMQNMKDAISSAVDVMRAMATSICSMLSKVEEMNPLVAELANITITERILLNHCRDLLSAVAAIQVKDCSLRAHVLQLNCLTSGETAAL